MGNDLLDTLVTWNEEPCTTLFGVWMRHRRHERGLTCIEMARGVQCSDSALSDWERGIRHPNENSARNLAVFFDVPPKTIYDEVRRSREFLEVYGQVGIAKLVESQPRPDSIQKRTYEYVREQNARNESFLSPDDPTTDGLKVRLPHSYYLRLMVIANRQGVSKATILRNLLVEAMDNGDFRDDDPKFNLELQVMLNAKTSNL